MLSIGCVKKTYRSPRSILLFVEGQFESHSKSSEANAEWKGQQCKEVIVQSVALALSSEEH